MSLMIPLIFAAAAAPAPLNASQTERLRCVAALAIIANDQQRGAPGWTGFPPLANRGAHFARVAGEGVIAETGRSKEQVRDAILAQVKTLQRKPGNAETAALGHQCLAVMDRVDPLPSRLWCAALAAHGYDQARNAGGDPAIAQNLGNIAAIMTNAAREEQRAKGKASGEIDQMIAAARKGMETRPGGSVSSDLAQCEELDRR